MLLAELIPWQELEEAYAPQFSANVGAPATPAFRKMSHPLIRTPGGLMERINASLQRGRLAEGFWEAVG